MASLAYLGLAVVVSVLIGLGIAWRGRRAPSMDAGLREFRRGLQALDPANDPLARSERGRTDRSTVGMNSSPERGSLAEDDRSG